MLALLNDKTINRYLAQRLGTPHQELRDKSVTGLCLRIGKKKQTWCIHVSLHKKVYRVRLGSWPCINTNEARRRALDWLYTNRETWNNGRVPPPIPAQPIRVQTYANTPSETTTPATGVVAPTLTEALDDYLKAKRLKPKTNVSYQNALKYHLQSVAHKPLNELTTQDIRQLNAHLLVKYAASTVNLQLRIVSAVYCWWHIANEIPQKDIFKPLRLLGEKKKSAIRDDVLSEGQISAIGQQMHLLSSQEQAFITIGLSTGFRLSELKSLTPSSIDKQTHTVQIHGTKNGRNHILPLPKSLENLLLKLQPSPKGKLLSASLHDYASIISRKIDVKFSAHTMRRTFASHAIRLGFSSYVVKALLNHFDGNDVTQTHYIKLQVDDLRDAMETINNHFANLLGIQS